MVSINPKTLTYQECKKISNRQDFQNETVLRYLAADSPVSQFAIASLFFICERCGKCCCKQTDIDVCGPDIIRISKHLNVTGSDFKKKYTRKPKLKSNPGSLSIITPCPFFSESGCTIYDVRPNVCVLFPCFTCIQDIDYVNHQFTIDPTCPALKKALDTAKNNPIVTNQRIEEFNIMMKLRFE